ncbi:MAG: AAA family ATPase [Myxococcota bacterium]|jgi:predicted outer membrane repeat protein|nr:AAA family ATPase [Myxococcota bacterium]
MLKSWLKNAAEHDVICVPAGHYRGTFVISKPLRLVADGTVLLEGEGDSTLVVTCNAKVELEGFIIRGGNAYSGGGLHVASSASVDVRDCVFVDNRADGFGGGAIYAGDDATLHLERCRLLSNRGKNGGAIALEDRASARLVSCLLCDHRAARGPAIAALNQSRLSLLHCTLLERSKQAPIFLSNAAGKRLELVHCVLDSGPQALWQVRGERQGLVSTQRCLLSATPPDALDQESLVATPQYLHDDPEAGLAQDSPGCGLVRIAEYDGTLLDLHGQSIDEGCDLGAVAVQTPARPVYDFGGPAAELEHPDDDTISAANQRLANALGLSQRRADGPYGESLEQLFERLVLLSISLKRYILIYGYRMSERGGQLNDTLVSVEEMLRFYSLGSSNTEEISENLERIDAEEELWRSRLKRRARLTPKHVFLALERLRQVFELDELACAVLIACAAPSIDVGFDRLYRYAWADFAQRNLSTLFIEELLGHDDALRRAVRACFAPSHPLRRYRLIEIDLPTTASEPTRTQAAVSVPNRIVNYLLGARELDDEHMDAIQLFHNACRLQDLVIREQAKENTRRVIATAKAQRARIVLSGPDGVGKNSLARAIAVDRRRALVRVDLLALPDDRELAQKQLAAALREAMIQGADLVLDDWRGVFRDREDVGDLLEPLLWVLEVAPLPVYFITDHSPMWLHGRRDDLVEIELALAPPKGQRELWKRRFEGRIKLASHIDLADVVQRYSLSAGSIHRAAAEAIRLAEIRGETAQELGKPGQAPTRQELGGTGQASNRQEVRMDDLVTAIRHQFHHRLGALAQPISTTLRWDDVVLKPDLIARIREIVAYAKHREAVYDTWGFSRKFSYGRGLSCMFSGPPGTGKTMMVCIIARELGRELFRVDVARVVDKYIGETEKNIGKVFEEAERSQAIILFDEADSLFSKRTDVKSSHDRYANLEVNYLLQRMEEFDGATFLTTNAETSIDEAFERRLKFKLKFPMPDAVERIRLWRSMFPPEAKIGNIDWRGLAEEFEMSGGLIKNAALRAAFYAIEDGTEISHDVVYRAALTELRDAGHVIRDDRHRIL